MTIFLFSKLNINLFFLYFIILLQFLLYFIKVLATGRPVAKFFTEYIKHYVLTVLLQDQIILMQLQSLKLIFELF